MSCAPEKYKQHAVLLREVGLDMLQRMQYLTVAPKRILDLGAGPDVCTSFIKKQYPDAQVVGVDDDAEFVEYASRVAPEHEWICSRYASLPFVAASFDVVFINLGLSKQTDMQAVLREIHRVLRPNGVVFVSLLGDQTRLEHIQLNAVQVLKVSQAAEQFIKTNFADPVLEMDAITLRYPTGSCLFEEMQTLGMISLSTNYLQEPVTEVMVDVILLHAFKSGAESLSVGQNQVQSISLHALQEELRSIKTK